MENLIFKITGGKSGESSWGFHIEAKDAQIIAKSSNQWSKEDVSDIIKEIIYQANMQSKDSSIHKTLEIDCETNVLILNKKEIAKFEIGEHIKLSEAFIEFLCVAKIGYQNPNDDPVKIEKEAEHTTEAKQIGS